MGILELARKDWNKHITSTSGAGQDILIETPTDAPVGASANIRGLAIKHHLSFDTDGQEVSSKKAHITISESDLVAVEYPVRDDKREVALHKHKVTYADSTGVNSTYLIVQAFPDEATGVITCTLRSYE